MGDWSICTTLSIWLTPRRLVCGPGLAAIPPSRRTSARASVSFNSELLPDPLTPVTHTNAESGNCTLTFLRLLVVTPSIVIGAGLGDRRRRCGKRNLLAPGQIAAGERGGIGGDCGGRALGDDAAAVPARPGPKVDQPIGPAHDRLVVLDDHHRVAAGLQVAQGVDQPLVVAGMQADRRLVEHVADADQAGAQPGGQADALQLAAAEGAGRPIQREVAQAHAVEEFQPGGDLARGSARAIGCWSAGGRRATRRKNCARRGGDRQGRDLVDRPAGHADRTGLGPQPRAAALRAHHLAAKGLQPLPLRFADGGGVFLFQHRQHAGKSLAVARAAIGRGAWASSFSSGVFQRMPAAARKPRR